MRLLPIMFRSLLLSACALMPFFAVGAPAAEPFTPAEPPNKVIGEFFGVCPSRVAWAHDPAATVWDGSSKNPAWWHDSNTRPEIVARMFADVLKTVTASADTRTAWNRLFRDINMRRGRDGGYQPGERIAIKLNLNQCKDHGDNGNASYTAPQLVRALIADLVQNAGVAPADITFFDAVRWMPSTIVEACRDFPGVRFVDIEGGDGRERAVVDTKVPVYLADRAEPIYFPTCVTEASYLINVAGLKAHAWVGMTGCFKNHLGSVLNADGTYAAKWLHASTVTKTGKLKPQAIGDYNGLVDLNGHEQLRAKTVLFLMDGLYAAKHNEQPLDESCRWQSAPFSGRWTASLFASQDPVAIDSVALDFLRSEPTLAGMLTGAVDNFLREAALAGGANRAYDPEKDGKPMRSLGTHEHWNNAEQKLYSRTIGTETGIELVRVGPR